MISSRLLINVGKFCLLKAKDDFEGVAAGNVAGKHNISFEKRKIDGIVHVTGKIHAHTLIGSVNEFGAV